MVVQHRVSVIDFVQPYPLSATVERQDRVYKVWRIVQEEHHERQAADKPFRQVPC